ncbi:MAG: AbrB/MazE/SpoVT family DNA-binding domain-containing protein [Sulfuricaulis sp.]
MKTKAQKWGNSLAVRVLKHIAQMIGLGPNDEVDAEVVGGKIMLTPVREVIPEYRLDDLLKKVTKKNIHREADWGKPHGKEVW